jgi:outer membrane protein TolC
MKTLRTVLVSALAALVVLHPIATHAQASQKMRLSIEEALKLGFQSSKTLHTAEMKVRAADAKVGESNAAILPSLSVTGQYARLSDIPSDKIFAFSAGSLINTNNIDRQLLADPGVQKSLLALSQAFGATTPSSESKPQQPLFPILLDNFSFQANVTYPVFTGFRLEAAKASADYNAQAATQDLSKDRLETEFNIKNAYWSLIKALELKKLTSESIEQVQSRLSDAQNMLKNGMMTTNDVLRLQVQLSNTKITNIDANNAVRLSTVALNNLLGLPLSTEIEPSSTVAYAPTKVLEFEQALQKAMQNRPEVGATELRIKAGQEGIRAAQGGALPQVGLSGSFLYANPNQRFTGRPAEWNASWQLGAQVSWTVWNWNTTGYQVAQAEAQVAQAEDALYMLKDGIKVEVTQNYLTLLQTREKVTVAEQAVEQAGENYRITNEKYKKGLALTSDMTDAETFRLQAKVNYISSVIDYEIAQARLLKSLGEQQAVVAGVK